MGRSFPGKSPQLFSGQMLRTFSGRYADDLDADEHHGRDLRFRKGSNGCPERRSRRVNRDQPGDLDCRDRVRTKLFDGSDEIPDQYKAALLEAKSVGLPALVVLSGDKVVRSVKDPRTESAVMEAVK